MTPPGSGNTQIDWSDSRAVADAFFRFGAGELLVPGTVHACRKAFERDKGAGEAASEALELVEAPAPGKVLELGEAVDGTPIRGEAAGEALAVGEAADKASAAADWGVAATSHVVDAAPSRRTACRACGKRFAAGELRVGRVFRCRAYGGVVTRTHWFHAAHAEAPEGGWQAAEGYDALNETRRAELERSDHKGTLRTDATQRAPRRCRPAADPPYCARRAKSPLQRFAGACRLAVQADVAAFREAFFRRHATPRCPVTGGALRADACHVHHNGPRVDEFHALVRDFVRARSLNLLRAEYLAGRLLDEALRAAFVALHTAHARLVVVSREANLTYLRKDPARLHDPGPLTC